MTDPKEKECSYGSTLQEHCSGCTDPRSEGTHQGCTAEHGHVGCDLSTADERVEFGVTFEQHHEHKTEEWEEKIDKMEFCCGGDDCMSPHDDEQREELKDFIKSLIRKAKEEGIEEGLARGTKDFCLEEVGYVRGKNEERSAIFAMIDSLPDLHTEGTSKVIDAHRLVSAIQERAASEKKEDSH